MSTQQILVTTATPTYKNGDFNLISTIVKRQWPGFQWFYMTTLSFELFRQVAEIPFEKEDLNARAFKLLDEISELKENWDLEEAPAFTGEVVARARQFIQSMSGRGQVIYHVSPGPCGEVSIVLRSGEKALEFLFYPEETLYVKVPPIERSTQGSYSEAIFPQLISWLNEP